jgi:hypothetical protein
MKRRSKKPWLTYQADHYESKDVEFDTYAELKKHIAHYIKISHTWSIDVTRTRRGEWGQWFETWELKDGKPVMIKETWL